MARTVFEKQKEEAKHIGRRARWARELAGLTPMELASDIGIDRTSLGHIELGRRLPSLHILMSLCHTLRMSPQYLLWGSLEGVDPELAAKLKQLHPELHWPAERASRPDHNDTEPQSNGPRARTRARYYSHL